MLRTPAGFRDAVARSHAYARELWVCDAEGAPLERVHILPGSDIQVGPGIVRRVASLLLPAEPRWIPRPDGLVWWTNPFLLRFGADGLWMDQPLLWPDQPEHDLGGRLVRLGCQDALRVVSSESRLARTLTLEAGSSVAEAFRRLLVLAGAPDDPARFDLEDGGAAFSGDHAYEAGALIAQILAQWQVDHRLELFAAPPAVLTLRPVADPLTTEPVATWAIGREVRLLGLRKRWRNLAKNHAIVEGRDLDGNPFRAESFDLNPDSPIRWGRPGVPDLVVTWESDGITTEEQALAVARSLLVRNAIEEEIEADVPIDPSLDRHDVVAIEEPTSDTVGRFALDSFPVPVAPGSHTLVVRRERTLS